jgi:hypothetical protein
MKRLLTKSLLLGLFLISCNDQTVEIKKQKLPKIAFTNLVNETLLTGAISQIGLSKTGSKSGRLMAGLTEFKPDSILKVLQSDSTHYTYTLYLQGEDKANSFKNLVFKRVAGGFVAFVLEYISSTVFLDISSFTGTVKKYDLEGTLLLEVPLNKVSLGKASQGGRTQACFADVITECVEWFQPKNQYAVICVGWVTVLEITCSGGSGGGTGTSPNPNPGGTYVPDPNPLPSGSSGGSPNPTGSSSPNTPSQPTNPPVGDPSFEGNDPIGVLSGKPTISPTFDIKVDTSLVNNQKANCVYGKLTQNSTFQNIIKDFDNNSGTLNLTFVLGSTPPYNGLTRSAPPYKDVTIILDKAKLEARRTVEVARTFLHEALHAKIFADLSKVGGYENLNKDNFPELFDAYVFYKTNGQKDSTSRIQHEYIARHYIDIIAAGLQQFDTRNLNNPEINLNHYRALAWEGLAETYLWENLMTKEQKDKIKDDRRFIVSDCFCTVINCN